MKSPRLRARPGVKRAHQLSAVVGIGANRLGRAGVAHVRARSVAGDAELVVELMQMQLLSFRALPGVEVGVEVEAAGPVAVCARMRVAREQIEHDGGRDQAAAVDRCQHDLGIEPAHVTTRSAGSVTSVKRVSSSSVIGPQVGAMAEDRPVLHQPVAEEHLLPVHHVVAREDRLPGWIDHSVGNRRLFRVRPVRPVARARRSRRARPARPLAPTPSRPGAADAYRFAPDPAWRADFDTCRPRATAAQLLTHAAVSE
jgi:hypothetical protein